MDAAFFQRDVFRLLARRGCGYAIKVGYWRWLPLKRLAAETRHWMPVAPDVTACETMLDVHQWNLRLRVVLYRRHVQHRDPETSSSISSPRTMAISSTTPSPRTWPSACRRSLAFIAGRGAQEKTLAELKGEFALDVVPTKHYTANSALYLLRPQESNSLLRREEYGRRG